MDTIKVLVADDHSLVRMGLVSLLETEDDIQVIGEADDGADAVRKARELDPDVVIMDLMMPTMDGIDATREMKRSHMKAKVLILTTSTVSDEIVKAIKAGALGAVAKSSDNALLISAIRQVAGGKTVVAPEIEKLITEDPPVRTLTQRQSEILEAVTRGLTNAEIALQLGIGPESVKDHLDVIFSKLGAANRAEAATIAMRKHLLKI